MIRDAATVRLLLLLPVLVLLSACARSATVALPGAGAVLGPGPMLSPKAIGEQFLWRQRVTASWGDRSESFDAVLQMHDEQLMLMGLGPMGRPGFIATLTEAGVTFENRSARSLPFPAEHIMADVQKVFYPWLPPVAASYSGTRTGAYEGLMISETYAEGRLVTRDFRRSDAIDRGELHVRYEGWVPGFSAPQRAELNNAWFGYELTIITVEQQRLPARTRESDVASR